MSRKLLEDIDGVFVHNTGRRELISHLIASGREEFIKNVEQKGSLGYEIPVFPVFMKDVRKNSKII